MHMASSCFVVPAPWPPARLHIAQPLNVRCKNTNIALHPVTMLTRRLRPATVARLIPVLANVEQTRRHLGTTSEIVDRTAVALLIALGIHVLTSGPLFLLCKAFALVWPLLSAFLSASRKNVSARARIATEREGNAILCGKAQLVDGFVHVTDGRVRVSMRVHDDVVADVKSAFDNGGQCIACAFVAGRRVVDVLLVESRKLLRSYPYVRLRPMEQVCSAAWKDSLNE